MPFPTSVNQFLAPAVAGDFASTNPRSSVIAGPGGLVAGTGGLTCGAFGWQTASAATTAYVSLSSTVLNTGQGVPTGFVIRSQRALQTIYLSETSFVIPAGFGCEVFNFGDFWALTPSACTIGQKVFASLINGSILPGTTGSTIAAATLTGTVSGSVLTTTAQSVAPMLVGAQVVGLTPATYITSFGTGSGAVGGTGTYNLSTSGPTGTATGTTNYVETQFYVAQNSNAAELTVITSNQAH